MEEAKKKTHWGYVDGDDGWTIGLTDFLPPSTKFSCSTTLDFGEVVTQLGLTLSGTDTDSGRGADSRPFSLPFASDFLRLLSLYSVLVFPLGQVRFILYFPFIVGISRSGHLRRV